jgi:Putative beta-barrel porin 2
VRGYDTNPARMNVRPYASSWFDIYALSVLVNTKWERHAFNADFRGAYTSYDTFTPSTAPAPSAT